MGEARRRSNKGLRTKNTRETHDQAQTSSRIISWFPITKAQRDQFIQLTIRGGWIGIGLLVALWLIVRIIGPAAGWWTPADIR